LLREATNNRLAYRQVSPEKLMNQPPELRSRFKEKRQKAKEKNRKKKSEASNCKKN